MEIDELIGGIVFYFRGRFDIKLALYFEVCMLSDPEKIVPKERLIILLTECLNLYNDVFESAKKIAGNYFLWE